MKIENSLFSVRPRLRENTQKTDYSYYNARLNQLSRDTISFSSKPNMESPIRTIREGNVLRISFKGELQNPLQTDTSAIQMKVRGVSAHQKGGLGGDKKSKDDDVVRLAASDWQEGQKINFRILASKSGKQIELLDPRIGSIGRVPDEIAMPLINLIEDKNKTAMMAKGKKKKQKNNNKSKDNKQNDVIELPVKSGFNFELSNVIAGNSKGAATIGLRVNLKYTGNDSVLRGRTQIIFDDLLNSHDKRINDVVMLYQPKASTDEVLERIFNVEGETNGPEAVKEIKSAISNISTEINDPENKNILILGHCKPDGDTLGCAIALETSIKGAYPDKNVDCAVDDKIPGLFRDKMPGIENVKRPYNPDRIEMVKNNIGILKSEEQTPIISSQIKMLEKELSDLTNPDKLFDKNPLEGKEKKKYDLVILVDIPTPKRFTNAFKDYIEGAKKVIYIDHHPHRLNEWQEAKAETGVDMDKIHDDHLALICDSVPAATQLVTIIADQAGILKKTMQDNIEAAKIFVASVITGTSTDTGSFTRTANLLPEHMKLPVNKRPNFLPEGMSKWLIDKLEVSSKGEVDKKWLRDNITFDIPDRRLSAVGENGKLSPRDKMITYALDGKEIHENLGLGFLSVSYDQMYEIWEDSLAQDEEITLLDIQNGFKYSEVMGALKANPETVNRQNSKKEYLTLSERAQEVYESPYNDDKIAILIIQDKKNGSITENSEIANMNGLRLSLRSPGASDHAELLASLFGGGGHGGAAGGRVDLPNVELDSKLAVKINGEIVSSPQIIYQELRHNYAIMHDSNIDPEDKKTMTKKIEVTMAEGGSGRTTTELITDIVEQIRANDQEDDLPNSFTDKKRKRVA